MESQEEWDFHFDSLAPHNDIESKHDVLNQYLDRKASGLPVFAESMKDLISEQCSEVETAVVMYGGYRIITNYSDLSCDRKNR